MKKNKNFILISAAGGLVCIIVMTAFILIWEQKKTEKYYEQLRYAQKYLSDQNYDSVVAAYKAAIELKPEDPQAYLALIEIYMENEQYVQAAEFASVGLSKSHDKRLESLMNQINLARYGTDEETVNAVAVNLLNDNFVAVGTDSEKTVFRYEEMDKLTQYCYQEYVDAYGDADITFVSETEGYRAKFKSLSGFTYFKNTKDYPDLINISTRVPQKKSKPYKIVISSPSVIFAGYKGYISYDKLCRIFSINEAPVYDEINKMYCVSFEFNSCDWCIETDSRGNIYKESPLIQIESQSLIKTEWIEEEEIETIESVNDSFVLGGEVYSYDITEIYISDKNLGDISELENCKNLETLSLVNCQVSSLLPVAGCLSLKSLIIDESTGFEDLNCLESLKSLEYFSFHGCSQINNMTGIDSLLLSTLDTCFSGITYEQALDYKRNHPECLVWFDNRVVNADFE